ncbi:MAG: GlsB/YeaQ/YmgE family stress response membrane protein [Armatimonadetes bacterium]|nr:GlsB/YeaQ/YmgE family stress response membrane protein [Armatimonadota bacterium]
MPLLFGVILLALLILVGFWLIGNILGVLLMLLVAGVVGFAADAVIPGRLPFGWMGAVGAGILGALLGTLVLGKMAPVVLGLPLIPTFLGALVVVGFVELLGRGRSWGSWRTHRAWRGWRA